MSPSHKAYLLLRNKQQHSNALLDILSKSNVIVMNIELSKVPYLHPNCISSADIFSSVISQTDFQHVRMGRPLIHNYGASSTLYYPFLFHARNSQQMPSTQRSIVDLDESFQLRLLSTLIFDGDIEDTLSFFANDRKHGAAQLAQICLDTLAKLPDIETVYNVAYQLCYLRPSMVAIKNAAVSVVKELHCLQRDSQIDNTCIRTVCSDLSDRWKRENNDIIPRHAESVLNQLRMQLSKEKLTVFTLSYSSSIFKTITHCYDQGMLNHVIIAESRPLYEGVTLASDIGKYCESKIELTVITDSQMALFIQQCDVVLLGADTINMDKKTVLNKSGSMMACLIAKYFHIPVYIISHESKFEMIQNDN